MAKEKKEKFDFIQPIKDIPKCFKGFPKNIVRVIKDPVKTPDEANERKRVIFAFLYLFIALVLVSLILSVAIPGAQDIFMIVGVVFGMLAIGCVFLTRVLNKMKEKFADLECPNCKKQITYDKNVQIKLINKTFDVAKNSKTIEQNGIPVQATITATGKEHSTFEITCKCQECGTEKTFTHEFVTVECEKSAVKVPYVSSGAMLVQFEADVRKEGAEGFEGKKGTTANGVKIKYNRTPQDLVRGYFGNEVQMR